MSKPKPGGAPKRREFLTGSLVSAAIAPMLSGSAGEPASGVAFGAGITDIDGIRVGHFTDTRRPTGCTVIIFDKGAIAGVDVRGSSPGTRETDLLNPINTVQQINAIVLSGGSAFGLAAADGVMRYLEEKGMGYRMGKVVVPIVPAAILFDLGLGDAKIRPTAESGYQACVAASNGPVAEGCVGAGAGATLGQMFGHQRAMKSGLGTASLHIADTGLVVGAIVAVNPFGDVVDPRTRAIVAGARKTDGSGFANSTEQIMKGYGVTAARGANTTIAVVATNAKFDKAGATKIAQMAHDGLARTISPIHTPYDGDAIFAACTGTNEAKAELAAVGTIAAEVLAEAVLRAVRQATSVPGLPACRDFKP